MRSRTCLQLTLATSFGLLAGCSGMGTTMTKVGRLGQNKGYEMQAEQPVVIQAAISVLKARGFEVSQKADPENGAEGAGQIVIGQRIVKYNATSGNVSAGSTQMDTRDLVDVYLSKKWQMSSSLGVPNITLVDIVGSNYLRKSSSSPEEQTPLTSAFVALLRDDIERSVAASRTQKVQAP